jgi:hypothetical protein
MFTVMRSENFYYFHQDCSKRLAEYWRIRVCIIIIDGN